MSGLHPTPLFRNLIFLSLLLSVLSGELAAQYFDMGVMGGVSRYYGDLTPSGGDVNLHPCFGGFIRYNFDKRVAFKTSFYSATISGTDENQVDDILRARNLSFKASITEFGFMAEFNILPFVPNDPKKIFAPYFTTGATFFHYNPTTVYNGQTVELQPLGTEGQGLASYLTKEKYSLVQAAIPLGGGLRYALNPRVSVAIEAVWRLTFTDFLDDVSGDYPDPSIMQAQATPLAFALSDRTVEYTGVAVNNTGKPRGNPDGKYDNYSMFSFTFSYHFYETFPFTPRIPKRAVKKKKEAGTWY